MFKGGYGIIPYNLMCSDLSKEGKLIMCYLLSKSGSGYCNTSVAEIGKTLCMSPTTISTRFRTELLGLVVRDKGKYEISYSSLFDRFGIQNCKANLQNCKGENQVIIDNERVKKKVDEKVSAIYISSILEYWNNKNIIIHNTSTINIYIKKRHKEILRVFSKENTLQAIDNYAEVYKGEKYYFNHKWPLWDFIARGLAKFIPDAEPKRSYLKKDYQEVKTIDYGRCPHCASPLYSNGDMCPSCGGDLV